MENSIHKIIAQNAPSEIDAAIEITINFKAFLAWKDHPKNAFNTCFNGTDKTRPKVCYEKSDKHFTIDELWKYWQEHDKSH